MTISVTCEDEDCNGVGTLTRHAVSRDEAMSFAAEYIKKYGHIDSVAVFIDGECVWQKP